MKKYHSNKANLDDKTLSKSDNIQETINIPTEPIELTLPVRDE